MTSAISSYLSGGKRRMKQSRRLAAGCIWLREAAGHLWHQPRDSNANIWRMVAMPMAVQLK